MADRIDPNSLPLDKGEVLTRISERLLVDTKCLGDRFVELTRKHSFRPDPVAQWEELVTRKRMEMFPGQLWRRKNKRGKRPEIVMIVRRPPTLTGRVGISPVLDGHVDHNEFTRWKVSTLWKLYEPMPEGWRAPGFGPPSYEERTAQSGEAWGVLEDERENKCQAQ